MLDTGAIALEMAYLTLQRNEALAAYGALVAGVMHSREMVGGGGEASGGHHYSHSNKGVQWLGMRSPDAATPQRLRARGRPFSPTVASPSHERIQSPTPLSEDLALDVASSHPHPHGAPSTTATEKVYALLRKNALLRSAITMQQQEMRDVIGERDEVVRLWRHASAEVRRLQLEVAGLVAGGGGGGGGGSAPSDGQWTPTPDDDGSVRSPTTASADYAPFGKALLTAPPLFTSRGVSGDGSPWEASGWAEAASTTIRRVAGSAAPHVSAIEASDRSASSVGKLRGVKPAASYASSSAGGWHTLSDVSETPENRSPQRVAPSTPPNPLLESNVVPSVAVLFSPVGPDRGLSAKQPSRLPAQPTEGHDAVTDRLCHLRLAHADRDRVCAHLFTTVSMRRLQPIAAWYRDETASRRLPAVSSFAGRLAQGQHLGSSRWAGVVGAAERWDEATGHWRTAQLAAFGPTGARPAAMAAPGLWEVADQRDPRGASSGPQWAPLAPLDAGHLTLLPAPRPPVTKAIAAAVEAALDAVADGAATPALADCTRDAVRCLYDDLHGDNPPERTGQEGGPVISAHSRRLAVLVQERACRAALAIDLTAHVGVHSHLSVLLGSSSNLRGGVSGGGSAGVAPHHQSATTAEGYFFVELSLRVVQDASASGGGGSAQHWLAVEQFRCRSHLEARAWVRFLQQAAEDR